MLVKKLQVMLFSIFISMLLGSIALASSQTGELVRDNYYVLQSISLGDANNKTSNFSTSGKLSVLKKNNENNTIDYELWTQGNVSSGSQADGKESVFGPVKFNRNSRTQEVSFSTKGFALTETVVNQVISQVRRNRQIKGGLTQEVTLDLLGSYLPQKLTFHLNAQKIKLKSGINALLIRSYSDVFKINVLPTDSSADNGYFLGMFKEAFIYNPGERRLYQMTSEFDVRKGNESLQIQDAAFLVGSNGLPVNPLIDMREMLNIKKSDKPAGLTSMPQWAMQAIKVQQVVALSSVTTAERASNPGMLPILSQIVELDGFAGIAGLPSSSSLIEAYGKANGGQAGELAGKFFSTVGSEAIGASGVLPETLLASSVPLVPALATAYSVYTMYSIAAELSAMALAADIGKLTPFEWPKCAPMECLAQADKAFDLKEPYQPPADPGDVPEVSNPSGGSGWGTAAWVAGGAAVIGGGVALGLSASKNLTKDDSNSNCKNFTTQVNQCHVVTNGASMEGFLVPVSCGSCPSGSYDSGSRDNISAGGPYLQCLCN